MQQAQGLTLVDALLPRLDADSITMRAARHLVLMVAFAGFVALLAQFQVRLPWTPVPVTGQTLGVLLAGGALGTWRGAGSLSIYGLAGAIGLPVFTPVANATAGAWDVHLFFPWQGSQGAPWDLVSGGYIFGFILAAAIVGFLAERGWDRGAWVQVALLLGTAIVYVPGVLWLKHQLHLSLSRSLELGLYPFIAGDLMKVFIAAALLPGAWALISNRQQGTSNIESL